MTDKYVTQQENFWAGEFGNEYVSRSQGEEIINSNIDFFKKALKSAEDIKTCIEFGSNIGLNIRALKKIYPDQEQDLLIDHYLTGKIQGFEQTRQCHHLVFRSHFF